MQDFEISLEDFKNAWMNLLFEDGEKKSCPNSKDPVLHLMKIFRAIEDLKAAFKECQLENHPYKMMELIHEDPQMYENGNALIMTKPIIEFMDLGSLEDLLEKSSDSLKIVSNQISIFSTLIDAGYLGSKKCWAG